jgi:hypothetical protein
MTTVGVPTGVSADQTNQFYPQGLEINTDEKMVKQVIVIEKNENIYNRGIDKATWNGLDSNDLQEKIEN